MKLLVTLAFATVITLAASAGAKTVQFRSPADGAMAAYHYSNFNPDLVDEIAFKDASGNVFADNFEGRDYRPEKGQWTASGRFFVYALQSGGGHSPWHRPFVVADILTRKLIKSTDLDEGDCISQFRLSGRDTIDYQVLDRTKSDPANDIPGIAKRFSLSEKLRARPGRVPQAADPTISGFDLTEPGTAKSVFGDDLETKREGHDDVAGFLNASGSEEIRLAHREGDLKNRISEVSVRFAPRGTKRRVLEKIPNFVSGKGVRLGITEELLKSILGEPHNVTAKGDVRTLHFRVDSTDPEDLPYDPYFGRYTFRDDDLVEFTVGFTPE